MTSKKKYFKMLTDILKDKGSNTYSRGGVYLFWSVLAFYLTLGVLTIAGISNKFEIEIDKFKLIVTSLEYSMGLFGGYVFGGKFIDAYKSIKSPSKPTDNGGEQA